MANIYTFDFSEDDENWTLNDANISGGVLNITAENGSGTRYPDANWLSGANDDFEIDIDFKIDTDANYAGQFVLKLDGDATILRFYVRGSVYQRIEIYYNWSRVNVAFTYTTGVWYTARIRRVGTVYYFQIIGETTEISWDYEIARILEYIFLGAGCTAEMDNFVYRWLEEIIKIFEDSGVGSDSLLTDKNLIFLDTGLGVDVFIVDKGIQYKVFEDSGVGTDVLKVDKTLVFSDTGLGVDLFKVNKELIFADTGEGVDIFLVNKEAKFEDVAIAIDKFYASYPYPRDLKRKIIIIRDTK